MSAATTLMMQSSFSDATSLNHAFHLISPTSMSTATATASPSALALHSNHRSKSAPLHSLVLAAPSAPPTAVAALSHSSLSPSATATTPAAQTPTAPRHLLYHREAQIYSEIALQLRLWSIYQARNALLAATHPDMSDLEKEEALCKLAHQLSSLHPSSNIFGIHLDAETCRTIAKIGKLYTQWWRSAWFTSKEDIVGTLLVDLFVLIQTQYAHLVRHSSSGSASTSVFASASTFWASSSSDHHKSHRRNRSLSMPEFSESLEPGRPSSVPDGRFLEADVPFHSEALRALFLARTNPSPSSAAGATSKATVAASAAPAAQPCVSSLSSSSSSSSAAAAVGAAQTASGPAQASPKQCKLPGRLCFVRNGKPVTQVCDSNAPGSPAAASSPLSPSFPLKQAQLPIPASKIVSEIAKTMRSLPSTMLLTNLSH